MKKTKNVCKLKITICYKHHINENKITLPSLPTSGKRKKLEKEYES